MKLKQFFQCTAIATVSALAYTSMQMQIISLAYQNTREEKQIRSLIEENGRTAYSIFSLKSANHIGVKMLTDSSGMQFADNVVQVSFLENDFDTRGSVEPNKIAKAIAPLLSLLTSSSQAEARTRE